MINGSPTSTDTATAGQAMPMMSGMEHPSVTVGAPPLVDPRILAEFCQAVQLYADSVGFHDEAADGIRHLKARMTNLQNLAQLCRMTVLGVPESFPRLLDELTCVAVDFPADPLLARTSSSVPEDEPDSRVQLGALFDLLAGAAFVSRNNQAQRDRLIIGAVRAVEDAICYPLAYSKEAAAYLSGSSGNTATN